MPRYASGKYSKAIDDRSGFKEDYQDLVFERHTGLWVHPDELDEPHPFYEAGRPWTIRSDPQALHHARPEFTLTVADTRITETGDTRVTEDGDTRVTE